MFRLNEIPYIIILALLFLQLCIKNRRDKKVILVIYMLTIAWYIVIARAVSGDFSESRQFNFTPFWSYANFRHADFRWQIFLNILVFIPFGFMLPWALNLPFWKSALIGFAFSALLEATQFLFCLGFCETDDLIHNTLGTIIGYGYWKLLQIILHHLQARKKHDNTSS